MAKRKTTGPKPEPKKGITTRSKEIIIECQMDITTDDLVARLKTEGYKPSPASTATLRADFAQSVRVLDSLGKLKGLAVTEKK